MRIAYCSLLLPEEKKLSERTKVRLSGISLHKVTSAFISGIDINNDRPVDIFNIINTVNFPNFPQLVFRKEEWNHSSINDHIDYHLGYINLFGIKYITQYLAMKKALTKWAKQSREQSIICVHHIYQPMMLAAVRIAKRFPNIKICLNTGDVPGKYGLSSQYKNSIKRVLIEKIVERSISKLAQEFDCFVFVTKDMATAFGVESKPYRVVECTYSEPEYANSISCVKNGTKDIFYAGAIRNEYGTDHLLRAFSLIKDPDYRLLIAGGGSGVDLVEEYARKDSRIIYLGFISPQEVLRHQLESTVLVSPRLSNRDYVKYSFPSKSVDSLASGIPYVAHCLPCDPPEYAQYINYPADETDEGLKDKLVEICELSEEDRKKIGDRARFFVLNEKNPAIMTRRVVDMWSELLNDR